MTDEELKIAETNRLAAEAAAAAKTTLPEVKKVELTEEEYTNMKNQITEKESLIGKHATDIELLRAENEALKSVSIKPAEGVERDVDDLDDVEIDKLIKEKGLKGYTKQVKDSAVKASKAMINEQFTEARFEVEALSKYPELQDRASTLFKETAKVMAQFKWQTKKEILAAAELASRRIGSVSVEDAVKKAKEEVHKGYQTKTDAEHMETNKGGVPAKPSSLSEEQKKLVSRSGLDSARYEAALTKAQKIGGTTTFSSEDIRKMKEGK